LKLRFGYVRFDFIIVIVAIGGRRCGRVTTVFVVVHFDFKAHVVAAVTITVHIATIIASLTFECSATSAVAAAATDVVTADIVSCTGGATAVASRR